MSRVRIGTSGWVYPRWRGDFYPKGLRRRDELGYLAERLDTVEINASFYALGRPGTYRKWSEMTPEGFVFAVKGSRFITHRKRLRDSETALANFLAAGVLAVDELGPILWQLPATQAFDADRLDAFCALLPRTTGEAARIARGHDDRVKQAWTDCETDRPMRHALEARHPGFDAPEAVRLLREHEVALVVADTAGEYPSFEHATAGFTYVRLHGHEELYRGGYDVARLDEWARKIRGWVRDGDVYVYFDNDADGRAPFDAMALRDKVG